MKPRLVLSILSLSVLVACERAFDNPWDPLYSFRVTYTAEDAESGTVPIDPFNYNNSKRAVVLGNPGGLARTGQTLSAWMLGTVPYQPGDELNLSASVTLQAH